MKILVTGGSGFLGSRLIPRLVKDGHEVYALARSTTSDGRVRKLGAHPIQGDLEAGQPIALPGLDAVVHAAAHFRMAGPRAPYFRTNVDGTKAFLEAAQKTGASKFVYVSAAAIIMDDRGSPIRNANESAPTFPDSFSAYIASKAQGEKAVLAADRPGFRTIALRPPGIWGPGDMFSRELPGAIRSGQFAFIERGDYPYASIHVDNLVEAIGCAIASETGGRAYFVNDPETVTFRQFVDGLAKLQRLSTDKLRSMPYGLAFFLGRIMEMWAAIMRSDRDPPLSRTMVRLIGRAFTTNDSAARRELGYVGRVSRAQGLATYSA
jgi:nucleoside-diphosphate-sugar epimerase